MIAIIGILVGLLLPAVQAAPRSRRRIAMLEQPQANRLATHNYEAAFKRFPGLTGSSSFSPQARVLPFIEQANLQSLIDFNQPLFVGPAFAAQLNPLFNQAAVQSCLSFYAQVMQRLLDRPTTLAGGSTGLYAATTTGSPWASGTGTNYDESLSHGRYRVGELLDANR